MLKVTFYLYALSTCLFMGLSAQDVPVEQEPAQTLACSMEADDSDDESPLACQECEEKDNSDHRLAGCGCSDSDKTKDKEKDKDRYLSGCGCGKLPKENPPKDTDNLIACPGCRRAEDEVPKLVDCKSGKCRFTNPEVPQEETEQAPAPACVA